MNCKNCADYGCGGQGSDFENPNCNGVTFEDENDLVLSLNGINYTHKQLEEMLDKANMYDGLCE
jgi:hypothetical protein